MVPTYSEYIKRYIHRRTKSSPPSPGEHHFVATYLVPKLYGINSVVPDYINPDGTKAIIGDVVYYKDEQHHFGIEVKLGTVRLTKNEFNSWIVNDDQTRWPDLFLGIGSKGLALSSWVDFRNSYISAVRSKDPKWIRAEIAAGYGPSKRVDELSSHLGRDHWFPVATGTEAAEHENAFVAALKSRFEA